MEVPGIQWGRVEGTFEEGQCPHRVLEPMTMINK
jgi:hypothetical protein